MEEVTSKGVGRVRNRPMTIPAGHSSASSKTDIEEATFSIRSYLFYTKLPVQSQEEVFLEYRDGAPIEEVRKTIMNRFLHSR